MTTNYNYQQTEHTHIDIPKGFHPEASMSFKVGKLALLTHLAIWVGAAVAIVTAFFIFDLETSTFRDVVVLIVVALAVHLLIFIGHKSVSLALHAITLRAFGGGKIHLHLGMLIEVYSDKPIKRNSYICAQLISEIIPLAILAVLTPVFWGESMYISLLIHGCGFLAALPITLFALKFDKTHLMHFDNGILDIYAHDAEPVRIK